MNIDTLNKSNNPENITSRVNSVNTFSFELELPESSSFADMIKENKTAENQEKEVKQPVQQADQANASDKKSKLVKSLQDMAVKDKIPFKIKDTRDIKLLVYAHDLLHEKDTHKIDISSLTKNDIVFFKQFMDNTNLSVSSFDPQNLQVSLAQGGQVSYKSFNISKGLADLIEYAYSSKKPVRLDFEGDSSVILRVDKEGKLAAEFLSSNKAMESILKSSIPHLRNKLDSEGIPYKEIVYKERNPKHNKEEQERD